VAFEAISEGTKGFINPGWGTAIAFSLLCHRVLFFISSQRVTALAGHLLAGPILHFGKRFKTKLFFMERAWSMSLQ
jgi:hypothetical protein